MSIKILPTAAFSLDTIDENNSLNIPQFNNNSSVVIQSYYDDIDESNEKQSKSISQQQKRHHRSLPTHKTRNKKTTKHENNNIINIDNLTVSKINRTTGLLQRYNATEKIQLDTKIKRYKF